MHGIFWELLVPAAFAVLGCVFLSGHGAGLIAGYNTMRRTEREKYDERALCRFMGWLMLYIAVSTALFCSDGLWPGKRLSLVGRIWLPIGIVCAIIYANTGGRFQKNR